MLSDHFSVKFLFPGDPISEDLSSLVVIGHYGINKTYAKDIGHYLAHGGNVLIAGNGLPINEGLKFRDTPILEALKGLDILIEPYLIGDNNSFDITEDSGNIIEYPLNVITLPATISNDNVLLYPFTGFVGIYLSPVLSNNNNFSNLLFSSKESWLVDSNTGLDGIPEGRFCSAVYGEGSFSKYFYNEDLGNSNRLIVLGNSISLTNYIATLGINNGYDFILRSLYKLNGDEDLLRVRHKYNWDSSFFKINNSLYKDSIINTYIIVLFLYSLLILIICFFIRQKKLR